MRFMPRSGWGARTPDEGDVSGFIGPVDYLIITHTAIPGQCDTNECCQAVRNLQHINMDPPQSKNIHSYMKRKKCCDGLVI